MKKRIVGLMITGMVISLLMSGCVIQSPIVEKAPDLIDEAGDVVDKANDKNEDSIDLGDKSGPFTEEEITEMYGDDEMIVSTVNSFIGTEMPDIELIDKNGDTVMLMDIYGGSPVIVEFMGTWCPVCENTIPHAEEFNKNQDIPYIFISGDEPIEHVTEFVGNAKITYYVAKDPDAFNESVPLAFVPASMFVDAEGIIQMVGVGEMEVNYIKYLADRSF